MKKPSGKKRILIALLWLLLWQLLSVAVHNSILLVGPVETVVRLGHLLMTERFYLALAVSWLRILGGLLLGAGSAVLLAYAAYRLQWLRAFLEPFTATLRSIPVASFVILVLIWVGGRAIAIYISAIIVFPIVYQGTLTGLSAADPKLRQMAAVFRFPFRSLLQCIEIPAALPSLETALTLSVGMAFKSGVAAEVIAQAQATLGNELYRSKIYLETGDLLAYTAVIIFCAWVSDRALVWLLHAVTNRLVFRCQKRRLAVRQASGDSDFLLSSASRMQADSPLIQLSHASKSFDNQHILTDVNLAVFPGDLLMVTGASGSGKSTLLSLLLHLTSADEGQVTWAPELADGTLPVFAGTVFQENRLCPGFTGADQIWMTDPKQNSRRYDMLAAELDTILGTPSSLQPAETYSGGMQRRCAILRALCCSSPLLVMDEPFSGLDEETRAAMLEYILTHRNGRALVLTVHDGNEVPGLDVFTKIRIADGRCSRC